MKIRPIILCGGAGTRLWPKSKKNIPKQFIDWGGWTLFDKTLQRIKNPIFDHPVITTNHDYLKYVKRHLIKNKITKSRIILEPFKKNTAPAILSSALIKEIPNNQPMIFITSDNLIEKNKKFNKYVFSSKKHLNNNNIFIFGIKPITPSSEYGYFLTKKISNNINKVVKFIEKPNKSKVKIIIKKKGYMNAGMFFARKDSLINNFKRHQPQIFKNCYEAVNKANRIKNLYYLKRDSFKKVKEISFDYAILEKAKNINGIKMNLSLTDLGNWKEIWRFFKGKKFRNKIKKNTFYRPWGKYINLFVGKGFLLKELVINAKSSISLQKHFFRSERWMILSGKPKITIDNKKFFSGQNKTVFIPKGSIHRIENPFRTPVKIIEVQMGSKLIESDILRYSDIYGRVKQ
jgi:mannose-1-phosphate guanylyltransferase/mannose-6-phosphate isomerase